MDVEHSARTMTRAARQATRELSAASSAQKNEALRAIARALRDPNWRQQIEMANRTDLERGRAAGLAASLLDRLLLDGTRVEQLAAAVEEIVALPDPVGRIDDLRVQPNGLRVGRMHVPLGVILLVYESRPNVTIDAAALCLKAGNAVILRGGKEAIDTNRVLGRLVQEALQSAGLSKDGAQLVQDTDRALLYALLARAGEIDLAIPRGGTSLIDAVNAHAKVPVLQHYQGICHVYVHEAADLEMAERIVINAKVQRPGVCNALECVVVDEAVAEEFFARVVPALRRYGVSLRADEGTRTHLTAFLDEIEPAQPGDYDNEFLDLILAIKVVPGYADAVDFLAEHGSQHTESIVTNSHDVAMRFLREVDASCVMVNASTRFNDGGALGLGAELGISTTKLHAYGPMGLAELCTRKFVVLGDGQLRGSPP